MKNDIVGKRFGRLVVVEFDHIDAHHNARFLCKCDCGCTTVVKGSLLRRGKTKSCGCLKREWSSKMASLNAEASSARMKQFNQTFWTDERREHNRQLATTHGGTHERLYRVWSHMKERCESPNGDHAQWYYEKGIRVCDEWQDYATFREWAFSHGYHDPKPDDEFKDYPSIDRINPELGYCPENCRWITISENSHLRNQYHANQSGRTRAKS